MSAKNKGVNIKRVNCPKCGTEQPYNRTPKGWKEILWGGWTCINCNCKMDRHGNERK